MNLLKRLFKINDENSPIEPTESPPKRMIRELLRENLMTIPVDVFTLDDPLVSMSPEERKLYLRYFHDLLTDKKLIDRIKYLINKQANMTLASAQSEVLDAAGAMNINGMGVIKNEIEKLSAMYVKENTKQEVKFNPLGI